MKKVLRHGIIACLVIWPVMEAMSQHKSAGERAHEEAASLNNENRFEEAQQLFRTSANEYRLAAEQTQDTFLWANYIRGKFNVWNMASRMGELSTSIDSISALLVEAEGLLGSRHPMMNKMYQEIGNLYYHLGKYPQALEAYQQAKHIIISDEKSAGLVRININLDLSWVLNDMDRNVEAKSILEECLEILDSLKAPKPVKKAEIYSQLAIVESRLFNHEQSVLLNTQALELYEQEGQEISYATVGNHINRGGTYSTLYRLDEALQDYEAGLAICKQIEDHSQIPSLYNNIGLVYKRKLDYHTAAKYFKQAFQYAQEHFGPEDPSYVVMINNLADAYRMNGDLEQSLLYYQTSLDIGEKYYGKQNSMIALNLVNLGSAYLRKMRFDMALTYFQRVLDIPQLSQRKDPLLLRAHNHIGNVFRIQKKWDLAKRHFQKVLKMGRQNNRNESYHQRAAYMYLAIIAREEGKYSESQQLFDHAIQLFTDANGNQGGLSSSWLEKGKLLAIQNQHQEALRAYEQAIHANVLQHIPDKEILTPPSLDQVLSPENLLESFQFMGTSLQQLGGLEELKQADTVYQHYFARVMELRHRQQHKSSWIALQDSVFPVYEAAIHNLLQLARMTDDSHYQQRAFELADQSKAFSLRQSLQELSARKMGGIPADILEYEHQLMVDFAYAEKQLYELAEDDSTKLIAQRRKVFYLKRELDSLEQVIDEKYPAYYQLKHAAEPLNLAELQAYLQTRHTALVNYVFGEKELIIFLVQGDSLDVWSQALDGSVQSNIDLLRRDILDSEQMFMQPEQNQTALIDASYALYQKIFDQIHTSLETGTQSLILVPDGPLNYLPFELLMTERVSPGELSFASLPYLFQKYALSYTYSAKLLLEGHSQPQTHLAGVGSFAPSYQGFLVRREDTVRSLSLAHAVRSGVLPLPFAAKEVRQVADLWDGDAFVGKKVSESLFREEAANYQILHLSMHAFLEDDNSLYSHLLFSQQTDSVHDGMLEVSELYNMKLNADLVVLSACNTGFGELQRGEGVVSLSRAFAYAGIPSTVMSLWRVPDLATSFLMERFHVHLKEGMSKPLAMNQARKDYLEQSLSAESTHPFYWSGFVVNGAPDPVIISSSYRMWQKIGIFLLLILPVLFLIPYLRLRMKSRPGKPE
ncbi:MAG: CHAT domain-containing protein [Bacteroidota bacterium]